MINLENVCTKKHPGVYLCASDAGPTILDSNEILLFESYG